MPCARAPVRGELLHNDSGATFGLPFAANRVRLVVQVAGRRALSTRKARYLEVQKS